MRRTKNCIAWFGNYKKKEKTADDDGLGLVSIALKWVRNYGKSATSMKKERKNQLKRNTLAHHSNVNVDRAFAAHSCMPFFIKRKRNLIATRNQNAIK